MDNTLAQIIDEAVSATRLARELQVQVQQLLERNAVLEQQLELLRGDQSDDHTA